MSVFSYDDCNLDKIFLDSKYTILYFYPKDNTPWCTKVAKDFTCLLHEFKNLNCQIIWVSKDSKDSHYNFVEKQNLNIILISDVDLKLHNEYQVIWEKNMYGKITTGVIRSTFLIDKNWKIIKERRNIKATWHAQRVLDFVANI